VVGGGDTAMEEASHLAKVGSTIYVIHRRDSFRASEVMQKRVLDSPKTRVVWNSVVTDVVGYDRVHGVKVKNVKTGEESVLDVRGMFVAIGHTPNTHFLRGSGLELDEKGYVKLSDGFRTYTNLDGVFAAGDVADQVYRQAVTAAGMGCKAALDAERWLAEKEIE
jgi:thioredoxin reductase (NADPH)